MTDHIQEVVVASNVHGVVPMIFKKINGLHYPGGMPDAVVELLEMTRMRFPDHRLYVHYGDLQTGLDWMEESDTYGVIGCSTGPRVVPLLCHPRSRGGGVFSHNVVRVRMVDCAGDFFRHPQYHHPKITLCDIDETVDGRRYLAEVLTDGKKHAAFKSMRAAKAWITRMGLTCTHRIFNTQRPPEPEPVLPTEQLRSLIFEEDDWD